MADKTTAIQARVTARQKQILQRYAKAQDITQTQHTPRP